MRRRWFHPGLVLLVCAAIYWPMLGTPGFGSSEGHRVAPAWEMLETGDWAHLRLFGLAYLRKPPGMPWAIAAVSSVCGENEWSARAVSAAASTVMALLAMWFAGRVFGRKWGLAAGLAQALMPLFVTMGRTAEIESLNALATQVGVFGLVGILGSPALRAGALGESHAASGESSGRVPCAWLLVAVGLIVAGLVKGPASAPAFLGVILAACSLQRSIRPALRTGLWIAAGLAAAVLVPFGVWIFRVNRLDGVVTQDFSEFTWSASRIAGPFLLMPAAIAAALPHSLALLAPFWGKKKIHLADTQSAEKKPENGNDDEGLGVARLLAVSWLASVVVLMFAGYSNPRYAMPGAVGLPVLAAYAIRECTKARREILARVALLGHAAVWPVVLGALAIAWVQYDVRRPRRAEGRREGAAIAAALPDGAEVWADDLIEARPDVLLYAHQAAREAGKVLTPRWMKPVLRATELPEQTGRDVYLLLRADDESTEVERYRERAMNSEIRPVAMGQIAKYEWVLYRVK